MAVGLLAIVSILAASPGAAEVTSAEPATLLAFDDAAAAPPRLIDPPDVLNSEAPQTTAPLPLPVDPPAWIEIPADLIATPTPTSPTPVPLPMLTNIPASPRDGSVVYLTFDDGPDPTYTNQILDVLARYGARATFFVLGSSVDAHPATAQRIAAEGHALGNHTYYHEALPLQTTDHVLQTVAATNSAIARVNGRGSSCLRPPYGSMDQRTFDLLAQNGYSISMWEVDSRDWETNDSYAIAAGVLRDTGLGNRVLFHDGPTNRAATVTAVASVLEVLSARGVQFHPLPGC